MVSLLRGVRQDLQPGAGVQGAQHLPGGHVCGGAGEGM